MSKMSRLAARPKLFWGLGIAFVVVVVVGVVAAVAVIGGSGDDGAEASDASAIADAPGGQSPDDADIDGGNQAPSAPDQSADGADGGTPSTEAPSDGAGTDGVAPDEPSGGGSPTPGSGDGGQAADVVLGSEEICRLVPGDHVSRETGLDIVRTDPAEAKKTPQCRYYFAGADNTLTNATISVLRPDEDMEGLSGAAAYRHAVQLNRAAAEASGVEVTETAIGVGDESILFENDLLRYGIIRYGERIVTIILTAPSADHATALDLAAATSPLALP